MNSTRDLLGTITALRQRLEQAKTLVDDAGCAATEALKGNSQVDELHNLRESLNQGRSQQQLLQSTLQQVLPENSNEKSSDGLPHHLSGGALRTLQRINEILKKLRYYANEPYFADESDPVAVHYQDTILLADLVLRTLKNIPEQRTVQMRMCSGLDVLVGVIEERTCGLQHVIERVGKENEQLIKLEKLLKRLCSRKLPDINPFFTLAEEIVRDMDGGQSLLILSPPIDNPEKVVAAHSLNTARIIARVARHAPEWQSTLLQPIVAGLIHDAGMLKLPKPVLQNPNSFREKDHALIERHCQLGAELLEKVADNQPWLTEAALCHHERLNGTGYPAGLTDDDITPLVRLLSVCDVYAACCAARPNRPALDTSQALGEVIKMAQRGLLDRESATWLEQLGPYPAGTAVELEDGSRAIVISSRSDGTLVNDASRPVVVLLNDKDGKARPFPQFVDLGHCESMQIARSIPAAERSRFFGSTYLQYV